MRIIAHLDMDAFFAAVEERDTPRLRGAPLVVGADPKGGRGRGVVSTANYKAREYGIRSAMPISEAWRLSEKVRHEGRPPAIFVGVDISRYGKVSENIMTLLRKHVPAVEEASIDEAYLDLSFAGSYEKAKEVCQAIKKEIKEQEHLTASIGIGPNKLVAKIASDMQKPDGLTVIVHEEVEKVFELLPIRKIPGIGPKTETMFLERGIKLVRDLKKFSQAELHAMLGKWGLDLYEKVRGRDESPVREEYEVKSIGEQETFPEDTRDVNFLTERLKNSCASVLQRFKKSSSKSFRGITLTVRFADFITKTRSTTLKEPAADLDTLQFEALKLLTPFWDSRENPNHKAIRLLGVRVEKLS